MRRLGCLLLLLTLPCCTETASTPAPSTRTPQGDRQQADPKPAARCAELGAIYDKYNTRRSEGSGGPDLERVGAGIDCQKGRYAQGTATLEKLLQRSRTPYPPA
jgi:hypothetical protein